MKEWRDQKGKVVTFDQFIDLIAQAILDNLIAFDRAGIARNEIDQIIGRDGGTLIGGGAMLQTPLIEPMTEDQGRKLFDAYASLLNSYDRGEIPESIINEITEAGNTVKKVEMIKRSLGSS